MMNCVLAKQAVAILILKIFMCCVLDTHTHIQYIYKNKSGKTFSKELNENSEH